MKFGDRNVFMPLPAIVLLVVLFVALCGVGWTMHGIWTRDHSAIPQQTQASNVALPTPTYKYQSAIVFYTCRLLVGIIFVDFQGMLHPVDPAYVSKLTVQQALELLSQAPSGHTLGVQTECRKDSGVTL